MVWILLCIYIHQEKFMNPISFSPVPREGIGLYLELLGLLFLYNCRFLPPSTIFTINLFILTA